MRRLILILIFSLMALNFSDISATHTSKPTLIIEQSTFYPGDTISLSGWTDFKGETNTQVSLEITLRNPDRDIIIAEIKKTNNDGAFTHKFTLSNDSDLGSYTVTVTSLCSETHSSECMRNSASYSFFVISESTTISNLDKSDETNLLIESESKTVSQEIKKPIVTETDLFILFISAILVFITLVIYLSRKSILRKKNEYDKGDYESNKDRDYEKYHSEWASDEIKQRKATANKDEKEYKKAKQLSMFPNYYDVLGISKNATQKEIKNQYRQLVKKWHPDKSNEADAEKKMSEIIRAYEILSNKERKETYDKYFNAI